MDGSGITTKKNKLRRAMSERLRLTTDAQRAGWSQKILGWLIHDDSWANVGGVVALFGGMKTEPNILSVFSWLRERGVQAAFFAIEGEAMIAYHVRGEEDLITGKFGVLEPKRRHGARLEPTDLSSLLVPGLAFGKNDGTRLGRGKGHYDRLLGAVAPGVRTVGVGFDLQLVPDVPTEDHDVRLRALVCESGWVEVD